MVYKCAPVVTAEGIVSPYFSHWYSSLHFQFISGLKPVCLSEPALF